MGSGLWALQTVADARIDDDVDGAAGPAAFRAVLADIIRAGGDADTNGAVAGALAGCYLGYSGLPQDWIQAMPYAEWLEAWVQKLLFMLDLPTAAER